LLVSCALASLQSHTRSLHDALPICGRRDDDLHPYSGSRTSRLGLLCLCSHRHRNDQSAEHHCSERRRHWLTHVMSFDVIPARVTDRKSTRLNSSHVKNSYVVFLLKK